MPIGNIFFWSTTTMTSNSFHWMLHISSLWQMNRLVPYLQVSRAAEKKSPWTATWLKHLGRLSLAFHRLFQGGCYSYQQSFWLCLHLSCKKICKQVPFELFSAALFSFGCGRSINTNKKPWFAFSVATWKSFCILKRRATIISAEDNNLIIG